MRKVFSILAAILMAASVYAQSPEKMSYQAVIRNSSDALVTNTQIGMEINIRLGSPTGTVAYTETQTPTTNANGLVSIEIGGGAGFSTINWASNIYFIETKTAIVPPLTTYTITGVSQLLSVPYALHAKTAETVTGEVTETDPNFVASPANGITGTNITNWNTTYSWGNHAGLYRPIAWDPAWADIIGKPTFATVATSGSYNDLANNLTAGDGININGTNQISLNITSQAAGNMMYFNGTNWVTVASGLNGQILKYKNGVPTWVDGNINDLSIGDSYQGGIIAYFLTSSDPGYNANVRHGLIAAPSDQSTGIQWYNGSYTTTGTIATAIGTGNANTNAIVANQGAGSYAAKLCADLVIGIYSDWYLPSMNELNKLYLNRGTIGGFASAYYWTSTETDLNNATIQYFINGAQGSMNKNSTYRVRAVRAF